MADKQEQSIRIDGKEYQTADLSEEALNQVTNLRVTDQEIARIEQQLAIYKTARSAYSRALADALPSTEH